MAVTYGAIAAPAAGRATPLTAESIAGRWSGEQHAYGARREKCDKGRCRMTLDISRCGAAWCGVLVKDDGSCGGVAMTVDVSEAKEGFVRFEGSLEFDPKAAGYVIQATLWTRGEDKAGLDIIGDTGKDMMFLRRSFPFQAHLVRAGAATCTNEKATS